MYLAADQDGQVLTGLRPPPSEFLFGIEYRNPQTKNKSSNEYLTLPRSHKQSQLVALVKKINEQINLVSIVTKAYQDSQKLLEYLGIE